MHVLAALLVLGLLILIHESGHFLAAIIQGIRVNGFSIGFGPALVKKEIKGVTFAFRALPLGGFVSFPDDDKDSKIPKDDPDLLKNRPIHQRAFVISAGVLANLLLAWTILIGQASFMGIPNDPEPGVLIMGIKQEEAAEKAGLKAGDQIISIAGIELGTGQEAVKKLVEKIQKSPGNNLELGRMRSGTLSSINITPENNNGQGRVGAQLSPNIITTNRRPLNSLEAINHSNEEFLSLLLQTIQGYKELLTNFIGTAKQVSGPVRIVEIGAQLSEQGSNGIFVFAALISINLAVLNSLPFPLLDGGQLMLVLIEGIRGRPIPEKIQLAFMQSGFVLLVGISIILIIRDTTQLAIFQQFVGH